MITVFTPTYNRAYILPALYQSLKNQSCKDFEWLIVDDGSTDQTNELITEWMCDSDKGFVIRYFFQCNGGKHRAINLGVTKALGDAFFIVDSDDRLYPMTIAILTKWWDEIKENDHFAGVSGLRQYHDGTRIGGGLGCDVLDIDSLSLRTKKQIKGDMAEMFRTKILRQFIFPEIEDEKFLTEAVVWNRIAQHYQLRYYNVSIYCCDYLSDGLTQSIEKHHKNSPEGTALYFAELAHWPQTDWRTYLIAVGNYWKYASFNPQPFRQKWKRIGWWNIVFFPLGWVLALKSRWLLK